MYIQLTVTNASVIVVGQLQIGLSFRVCTANDGEWTPLECLNVLVAWQCRPTHSPRGSGAVQVGPDAGHSNVGFIHPPGTIGGTQLPADALVQFRRIS